jgi:hypothetical protein
VGEGRRVLAVAVGETKVSIVAERDAGEKEDEGNL